MLVGALHDVPWWVCHCLCPPTIPLQLTRLKCRLREPRNRLLQHHHQPTMDATQLAAAIAQAQAGAGAAGAGPAAAGGQPAAGGAAGAQPDIMTLLVRDHLFLRQEARPVHDATQIAVLFKTWEVASAYLAMKDAWVAQLPGGSQAGKRKAQGQAPAEQEGGAMDGRTPHPYGPKKIFMIGTLFTKLKDILEADGALDPAAKQRCKDALAHLQGLSSVQLDSCFSGLQPRFPKPVKDALIELISASSKWNIRLELKRGFQNRAEEQLWQHLRSRPRA